MVKAATARSSDKRWIDPQVGEDLIARYIQEEPNGSGRHRARVVVDDAGVPVWVLAGYIKHGGEIRQAAADYDLPEEAVEAALAYHARHSAVIDAWLTLNEQYDEEPSAARG